MNSQALLAVQLLDSQLDHLAGERKRLPERAALATATAQQAALTAEDLRLRAIISTANEQIASAERHGAELDAKRSRLEAQLRSVSTQRQADALTHEIEMIVQQHSDLDDRELAAMEAQGDAEVALEALRSGEAQIVEAVERASADLDRVLGQLGMDESLLLDRRAAADGELTDAERSLYATLRAKFGGMAICQLDGRRCTGCHLDLSATEADEVRHAPPEELPECPHCGRLIAR